MPSTQFNLSDGQRAERKLLITALEWLEYTLLTTEPDDWATDYEDYYEKTANGYVHVSGAAAPTWASNKYYSGTPTRELCGVRTEDSSIEYNADIETTTDILGNNYTDLNKTQPEQTFDASPLRGGSKLQAKLNDIRRRNAVSELQGFTAYILTGYAGSTGAFEAEKHSDCSVTYDSIGGDTTINFPYTVHFSNKITTGTVDKLTVDFVFTPDV